MEVSPCNFTATFLVALPKDKLENKTTLKISLDYKGNINFTATHFL